MSNQRNVSMDMSDFRDFFQRVGAAARGDFRRELEIFLEGIGEEFLTIVQNEIIRREVTDTRLLLASFERGSENGVWRMEEGGMALEVGTNVEYAAFVNNGHWTIDPENPRHFTLGDGTLARFVPGVWEGDRFRYIKGAATGMVLKQQWVKPQPYFDGAIHILEKTFPQIAEQKLQEWLDSYFG